MKIKMWCFALPSLFLFNFCQQGNSSLEFVKDKKALCLGDSITYSIGDTLHLIGSVHLNGQDYYRIHADCHKIPFCLFKDSLLTRYVLPDSLKKEGQRVKFSGILLPIPAYLKSDCALMELLNIELVK